MIIQQLPETLANKIAAGEVVERPASVVKELVENSIDAGSTWIEISIKEAGLEEIKIIDNGTGMSTDDCKSAFLRHATSKISNETDLFHVRTLGFRGEALASIASVSQLTIKTSTGNTAGTMLQLDGGKIVTTSKSNARKGTEIIVKNLFFNTPARLKYMKTIHTELGHITDLLNRLALANPSIRFKMTHNNKILFQTTGQDNLLQVISQVYGMNVAKKMVPVSHETLDFKIFGFISKPELTRASRSYISTIINKRYIRSIGLARAITQGYHTLLPIHRFPMVVLFIEMDPILVDVNVHPTKLEVRFSKERELFSAIENMIRSKLRSLSLIPEMREKGNLVNKSVQQEITLKHESTNHKPEEHPTIKTTPKLYQTDQQISPSLMPSQVNEPQISVEEPQAVHHDESDIPSMYPIGQLHGTYILAQNDDGLFMIDQHAAQERIKYEYFKKKLGKPINETQSLLFPITIECTTKEAIYINKYKDDLKTVGLFLDTFGHQSFAVRSYPAWFPTGQEETIIREMIDQIIKKQKVNIEQIREESAILMACKKSIKANHHLTKDEMFALLEDLKGTTDPYTCPHGRPVIIHFSTQELEKMFKRIM